MKFLLIFLFEHILRSFCSENRFRSHKNLFHLVQFSLIKKKLMKSSFNTNDQQFKNPINIIDSNKPIFADGKPMIVLDYYRHEEGIINYKDLEMDELGNFKQGFIGKIMSISAADFVS